MKKVTLRAIAAVVLAAALSGVFGSAAAADCTSIAGANECHDLTLIDGGGVTFAYGSVAGGVLLGSNVYRGVILIQNGYATGAVTTCDETVKHQIALYGINQGQWNRIDTGLPCDVVIPV